MSTPFFPVNDDDWDAVRFNFDRLSLILLDTGGSKIGIRVGSSSATFTAAADSAQVTVPHGLGTAPAFVAAFPKAPQNGRIEFMESTAADATNIYIKGIQTANAAVSVTQNFYWVALG